MRLVTDGDRAWLEVRRCLQHHRHQLAVDAAGDHDPHVQAYGAPLLARAAWLPPVPIDLTTVRLTHRPGQRMWNLEPGERYSETVTRLAPPRTFENRATYRLIHADAQISWSSATAGTSTASTPQRRPPTNTRPGGWGAPTAPSAPGSATRATSTGARSTWPSAP